MTKCYSKRGKLYLVTHLPSFMHKFKVYPKLKTFTPRDKVPNPSNPKFSTDWYHATWSLQGEHPALNFQWLTTKKWPPTCTNLHCAIVNATGRTRTLEGTEGIGTSATPARIRFTLVLIFACFRDVIVIITGRASARESSAGVFARPPFTDVEFCTLVNIWSKKKKNRWAYYSKKLFQYAYWHRLYQPACAEKLSKVYMYTGKMGTDTL